MRLGILIIAAVNCLLAVTANAAPAAADLPQSVKIGALLHLTGDLAMQGAAFRQGIELAAASINKSGGINGVPISLVFEDTQLKPSVAHDGAKKLLEVDHVVAGLVSTSAETKSAGSLFESKKVPLICLWDSAPEIERLGQYVFGIGTWTPSSGTKVAEYSFNNLGARRAAIINNVDEWALSVSEAFGAEFNSLGGKVVFNESVDPNDPDFRSVIARMIGTKPDVLYAPIGFNTVAFFKQLSQLRFEKPVFESDNLNDEIISAAGDSTEGVYQTQSINPDGDSYRLLVKLYEAQFGHPPTMPIYVAWGFDAVQLIAQAVKIVGPNPELINHELYKARDFSGASGKISISSEGSSRVMVGLFRVRNGKLVLVER
jgi:branched-chain amino acid transport system substrate-binding protein